MPWTEKLPNGEDAILAALPDSWKRIFKRRGALDEQDGPAIADRVVKPEWAGNSNPVELNAPQVTTGSLVSGRDPGEMVVARGTNYAMPQGQEPIATPPEFTRPRRALPPASPVPDLPILPKTISGMSVPDVRGGDTIGKAMPVDPNQMPDFPARNFSQYVLAPDQTKNPDYVGHQPTIDESARRPKVNDELGYAMTHTPMPRHGRAYETGKGALLGFLRGVGTTGTIGGGLGGAATLGTMSAIDPKYAESAQNQMFTIPRLQHQEAIRVGRNEQALKQAGQAADIGYKRAQTDEATARAGSLRNPKPNIEIKPGTGPQGYGLYAIDKNNVTSTPFKLPVDPRDPSKPPPAFDWLGKRYYTVPNGQGGWTAQEVSGLPADKSKETVELTPTPGGPTLNVPQGQAATALIQAGGTAAGEENAQGKIDYENELGRWGEAADAVAAHTTTRTALSKNIAEGKALEKTRGDLDKQIALIALDPSRSMDLEKDKEYQELVKRKEQLDERYEKVLQENGRLNDAYESAETNLQGRHAPYVRRRDDGSYEAVARPTRPSIVRRAQPRVGQGKYTEAEVRRRAGVAGKNPDDAVKQARSKGLIQ